MDVLATWPESPLLAKSGHLAIVPNRVDPACAMDGPQPDQPFPITVPGLT